MVDRQLRRRGIEDERVLAAMEEVPRERFLPERMRRRAYRDGAVRIGEGQTMSQPWIVACMAQLLELTGDEVVLEVGTGSGYAAAVLSRLCREVVTIERFEGLAAEARARSGRARLRERGGARGRRRPRGARTAPRSPGSRSRRPRPKRRLRPCSTSSRPAPRWCARSSADGESCSCASATEWSESIVPCALFPSCQTRT